MIRLPALALIVALTGSAAAAPEGGAPPPLAARPAALQALLDKGRALAGRQAWSEAHVVLDAASKQAPRDAEILTELGLVDLRLLRHSCADERPCGWLDEGRRVSRLAIEVAPTPAMKAAAQFNLGLIEEADGDALAALAAWDASLALRPSPIVEERRAKLAVTVDRTTPRLAPFRALVLGWAVAHQSVVESWWTAALEPGDGLDLVAVTCRIGGDSGRQEAAYLVEDLAGHRFAVGFEPERIRCEGPLPPRPPTRPSEAAPPGPVLLRRGRVIHHVWQYNHSETDADLALRHGRLVTVLYRDLSYGRLNDDEKLEGHSDETIDFDARCRGRAKGHPRNPDRFTWSKGEPCYPDPADMKLLDF